MIFVIKRRLNLCKQEPFGFMFFFYLQLWHLVSSLTNLLTCRTDWLFVESAMVHLRLSTVLFLESGKFSQRSASITRCLDRDMNLLIGHNRQIRANPTFFYCVIFAPAWYLIRTREFRSTVCDKMLLHARSLASVLFDDNCVSWPTCCSKVVEACGEELSSLFACHIRRTGCGSVQTACGGFVWPWT